MVSDSMIDVVIDFLSDYSVPLILGGLLGMGLLGSLYLWSLPPKVCVQRRVITALGACNKNGYCGVMLDGGVVDTVSYPVVGAPVCTEWSRQ